MKHVQNADQQYALVSKPYRPLAEFKGDTLKYLQYNFIERKDQYEGKKLSVLLKDLEFDIKYTYPSYLGNDVSRSDYIAISFYESDTHSTKRENGEKLYVLGFRWEEPVMAADIDKIRKEYGESWTNHHQKFFGKQLLKDIYLIVHPDPKLPK
jgi:hypothetical protein